MIRDLTLTLRNLLMRGGTDLVELGSAQVSFDRPSDSFNPSQPTISLYLYDIRENTELRATEPEVDIGHGQATFRRPALRVACTYLVTAWPGNVTGDELALREHRLLSQALMVFWRYPKIPETFLIGTLGGQNPRPPVITAQAEGLRNPSEFWTALNNRMRPSLSVTATIALRASDAVTAPLVVTSEIMVRSDPAIIARDTIRIGGRVTDAADAAVSGAAVGIPALGLHATTDQAGRYILGPLSAGTYTIRVALGTMTRDVAIRVPGSSANGYDIKLN